VLLVDTTPPSTPTNLATAVQSSSQINLSWTASTDNVGVAGYLVERCQGAGCTGFAQIASPSATSYSDTGLSGSTTYVYRVRAVDGAGNFSAYSASASATSAAVSNKFNIGDRIILLLDTLVRSTPSLTATRLGTHLTGELGTIIGGP